MISTDTRITFSQPPRAGLTLIEILIALTMTLIVLGAMMSAFQYASAEMQNGRAVLEMSNRVRVAENLLRRDLANLTVEPRPYIGNAIPNGYFEYIEGPRRDLRFPFGVDNDGDGVPLNFEAANGFSDTAAGSPTDAEIATIKNNTIYDPALSYLGDVDDILAMTVRSVAGQVFRGRIQGNVNPTESAYAEVVWWTQFNDSDNDAAVDYSESVTVFRRVLVIDPDLDFTGTGIPLSLPYADALEWLRNSDVSVRLEPAVPDNFAIVNIVPNSLQDLANRRNRFARFSTDANLDGAIDDRFTITRFPHLLNRGSLIQTRSSNQSDILLNDIASFDVKVFDPTALIFEISGVLIEPCTPAFVVDEIASCTHVTPGSPSENAPDLNGDMINDTAGRTGAYVNLGYADTAVDPTISPLAAAAGNAGLGGIGQFSQSAPPAGFGAPGSAAVPKGVLNYQFNFHGPSGAVENLLDTAYDTWTPQYENDGINQDPNVPTPDAYIVANGAGNRTTNIDQGTNGIDDDGMNGPDDYNERETQPPYPHPITALKVTFRLVEKQTGEVRQSSVVQSFNVQ